MQAHLKVNMTITVLPMVRFGLPQSPDFATKLC